MMNLDAERVEGLKLPVAFGNTGQKHPAGNTEQVSAVELESLGQSLYNFRYVREAGTGSRKVYLKSRECRIILEGTVYDNGTLGMTRLLGYSVSKDLSFKRAVEVYTFMHKALSGNKVHIRGRNLDLEVTIPHRYESLKLLKIVETLYKYNTLARDAGLNPAEKVENILGDAVEINELYHLMRESSIETMVKLAGESLEELPEAGNLRIIQNNSIKLKKSRFSYIKEIEIPDFVLKNKESSEKMSTSWKKARITYKKVLD